MPVLMRTERVRLWALEHQPIMKARRCSHKSITQVTGCRSTVTVKGRVKWDTVEASRRRGKAATKTRPIEVSCARTIEVLVAHCEETLIYSHLNWSRLLINDS